MQSTRTRLDLESLDHRIVPARIDLRTAGSEAVLAGGAIAHRIDGTWNNLPGHGTQSHGTGALQTYLTVDADGVERGYNTDFRPVQFDASSDTLETRALPLSNVPVVTVDGQQYREFVLNVDQVDANGDRQLSVDEIQIFTSTASNLRNYNNGNNTLRAGSLIESPIWSLDALDGSTNDWLQVRAMTNQGNRAGEIALLVPNGLFAPSEAFVYIYTRMGVNRDANQGAEQWGVRTAPTVDPPGGGASISGTVFIDPDQDPSMFPEDHDPLVGVRMVLFDEDFNLIAEAFTDGSGNYTFENLVAGTYNVMQDLDEPSHDPQLADGLDYVGTVDGDENGTLGDDQIEGIVLADGDAGINYNFTEIRDE